MLLDHALRPTVLFDPTNTEHRRLYLNFMQSGSWGTCPYRFQVTNTESNNNLAYALRRMLLEYYISKEFNVPLVEIQNRI